MGESKKSDEKHPKDSSSFFARITFSWLLNIFLRGYKRDLDESDLYVPLREHKSELLGNKLQRYWQDEIKKWEDSKRKRKPRLWNCIAKIYGPRLVVSGIGQLIYRLGTEIAEPIILAHFLNYFSPHHNVSKTEACYWGAAMCINRLISTFIAYHVDQELVHLGIKINVACSSLIYRKVLQLSPSSMDDSSGTTIGQIINLLSNDVGRFDYGFIDFHDLWLGPLQVALVAFILYQHVDWAALVGFAIILFCLPLLAIIGKKSSAAIPKAAYKTDKRLRFMNEVIKGIQTIKMYAWEIPFSAIIEKTRINEIKAIKMVNVWFHLSFSFEAYVPQICSFASIATYVYLGNQVTADKIYMMIVYYEVLRMCVFMFMPLGIEAIIGMKVSCTRIQNFLLLDEVTTSKEIENKGCTLKDEAIVCDSVTAKWNTESDKNALTNLSFNIKEGKIVGVVGQVGSGKSSLLRTLIGELVISSGTVKINGKIAYASQESWIFPSSIKQNILFGKPFDKERYEKVISVCQLHRDLQLFPYGDKTIVGDHGMNLSGGQRARINLARAVYSDADIYLLDDPLSAVDTEVGRRIFDECLSKYLRGKTIVLITHQIQYMKHMDYIICLDNGKVVVQGKFTELQNGSTRLINYLNIANKMTTVSDQVYDKPEEQKMVNIDSDPDNKEERSSGKLSSMLYVKYFQAARNVWFILATALMIVIYKASGSGADYLVSYWVNMAEGNDTTEEADSQKDWYVLLFGVMTFVKMVTYLISVAIFYEMCIRISKNLHMDMFHNIVHATMRFFHRNPSGRIMNRFSKDMDVIDLRIPLNIYDLSEVGLHFVFSITLIITINEFIIPSIIVMLVIFYFLRDFYLRSSRDLKRLEGTTRSPIFDHLSSTFQGITTIRAFNAQEQSTVEFDGNQDVHTSAYYLYTTSSYAFAIYVDIVIVLFMASSIIIFLAVDAKALVGDVGFVMTRIIWMCFAIQWAIRVTTQLENQMISVERIIEYTKLEQEPSFESTPENKPSKSWPDKGHIVLKDLSIKYDKDSDAVLKKLNFEILPKEKIGIVGRTGAGKTSLISALFHLAYMEGEIYIDGIPISSLGVHDLRSKISIIPQEPILFEGTLRRNLDPFEEYSDAEIWQALEDVKLKTFIENLLAGLETKVSEGGMNYSVGQRQLLCLARTILKKNKIMVLDEATANVDLLTDELIQQTIREKFQNCTVLTVAHRLNTIMDSNRVLVMDNGSVVEFDHPFKLLERKIGFFYNLVQQTGPEMAKSLTEIAKSNYEIESKGEEEEAAKNETDLK